MARTFDFESRDGTRLRGWTDDGDGVPLLISNGLATIPQAWPALVAPDSGYRTSTWYYRGTFGSRRPADRSRVRIEDHVDDAVALLDAQGIDRAIVACWSIGVNIGFELAQRHPDRVAGLMAVGGVPGGTFATMGAPLGLPRLVRKPVSTSMARYGQLVGPALTYVAHRLPVDERIAWLVSHSGFMLPSARLEVVTPMLREFVKQDWRWFFTLALAAAKHDPMDLSFVECPVTLVAGQYDVLTSVNAIVDAAAQMPHAEITVLPGSHFLPMEFPERVHDALDALTRRTDLAPLANLEAASA